jgi:hypothetical protein
MMVHGAAATFMCHSIPLAHSTDAGRLSGLQVLLRLQIESSTATTEHVETHKQGRTKLVCIGQVGIRCRHCAHLPLVLHTTGSTYSPTTVSKDFTKRRKT